MTLIQEVERVESNSTKIDRSKDNINTKLVELGGESSIDLAGVPEKMQNMINNYKKIAYIEHNTKYSLYCPGGNNVRTKAFTIPLNLHFTPTNIMLITKGYGYSTSKETNDSLVTYPSLSSTKNNSAETGFSHQGTYNGRWWIDSISNKSFNLNVKIETGVSNSKYCWLLPPFTIIAIE